MLVVQLTQLIVDTVDAVNATITGAQFLCPGEQSTLSVPENPDGTYTWRDGSGATIGSTRTVTVNASGAYTVDVTACSSALTGSNSIVVRRRTCTYSCNCNCKWWFS